MPDKPLSRTELLDGGLNRGRRAARLLSAIEAHCLFMREESLRVIAAYLIEGSEDFRRRFDVDYLKHLKLTAAATETLLMDHLERFASQWKHLVPADPDLRARILRLVLEKYGLGPATFSALGGSTPEVQAAYKELFTDSLDESSRSRASGIATEIDQSAVEAIQAWQDIETRLEWLTLVSGEILYEQGDPGDALFVVISGRLRVTVAGIDGSERIIGEVGRGELVGEMAVLTGETRSATVRAIRDSEIVRLGRSDLLALSQRHLEAMVQINALIARRLRKQYSHTAPAENSLMTYALVPTGPEVALQEFGHQLALAMGKYGLTMYVNKATVNEAIETGAAQASLDDPRNPQIVSWLSELEAHYRYVIYEAAADASEWSRRCIRQADRIILVGSAGGSPKPAAHETALLAGEALTQNNPGANRVHLVLIQKPDAASPTGTAAWLEQRSVRSHHHIRLGDAQQMGHTARCLTGHALGLVLGGGGALGFAHVGVLRAMEEAGLEVDIVGGTSMGAIISGAVGVGMDWRQMREIAVSFASPLKLFDPTLPVVSLFTSGKVTSALQKIYGNALIEDLWRPMFCVSSNLSRSREMVYRQGPLWKAVRASMAVPGIFAPIIHEGDVHVDGAVMNNVPIDVMRGTGMAGTVIGVNVMPLEDLDKQYSFGDSISGPRAALSMLNPFDGTSVPMIYETLVRVMALHEVHQEEEKRRLCDVYITPPVGKYNILDFGAYAPIIEIGYCSGQEALAAWKGEAGAPGGPASSTGDFKASLHQLESTLEELDTALAGFKKPA